MNKIFTICIWEIVGKNFIILYQNKKLVLIVKKKNVARIKKVFTKEFMPYQIGFVSNKFEKKKVILLNALKW